MKSILLFFKKLFAWFLTLFLDRKKIDKKKKKVVLKKDPNTKEAKFVLSNNINRNEDMGESHIIDIYPYTQALEVKSIYELIDKLKEEMIKKDELTKDSIKELDSIKEVITENLNVYQTEAIKEVLEDNIKDYQEEKVVEEEKEAIINEPLKEKTIDERIETIKEDINKIVDNKLDKHEEELIEKAFYKYEKVNYVIATTVEIDEIKINNHKKSYYVDKIKEIKKKIERLEKINKNPNVQEELKRLKEDFYTKSVDKYDILYNKEVFISISKRCDDLNELLDNKEKEEKRDKEIIKEVKEKEREERERKYQEKLKEREELRRIKKERKERERDLYHDNIIKRYKDLSLSNAIILANILNHSTKMVKKHVVEVLHDDYDMYLKGEENTFFFDRNKKKTEVSNLYNSLLQVLCNEQKVEYQPITHINYPYYNLLEETIDIKSAVDNITFKKTGYDMVMDEKSVMVHDKLNHELSLEKINRQEKGIQDKVLIRKVKGQ